MERRNKALYLCIVLTIPLLALACGVDTLNYLGSDTMPVSISQSPIGVDFSGPLNPSILYNGVNLYYRIYASETEAMNDKTRLDQRQSSENVPGSSVPTFLVSTLRYERPARIENRAPPTIPESLESGSMRIELIDGRLYLKIGPSSSYELKRNLPSGLVDFSVWPIADDADFNNMPPIDPGSYYVQFFAASYGFDFLGSNPELFSNAVYLGRLVISGIE